MRFLFAGDFFPTQEIVDYLSTNRMRIKDVLGDCASFFKKADYSFVNLEYPITEQTQASRLKLFGPIRKGDKKCLELISKLGFTHACLANNHIGNYGSRGIIDTVNACHEQSIKHIGITESREVYSIELVQCGSCKIALVNVCENEYSVAIGSSIGANSYDLVALSQITKRNTVKADFFILIIHGGTEWNHYPSPRTVNDYRHLIDCGFNVIVSHHSHVVSGYEKYNGGFIAYGLGNFVTFKDWGHKEIAFIGQNLMIETDGTRLLSFEISPFVFDRNEVQFINLANDALKKYQDIIEEVNSALQDIHTLQYKWEKGICVEEIYSLLRIFTRMPYPIYRFSRKVGFIRKLLNLFLEFRMRRTAINSALWNVFRCETHQDVLDTIYKKYYYSRDGNK